MRSASPALLRAPSKCKPIFYQPVGAPKPHRIELHGRASCFGGGGTDVNGEFVWIHDTIAGSHDRRGGDLVVLRATGITITIATSIGSHHTIPCVRCSYRSVRRANAARGCGDRRAILGGLLRRRRSSRLRHLEEHADSIRGARCLRRRRRRRRYERRRSRPRRFVFNAINDNRRDASHAML